MTTTLRLILAFILLVGLAFWPLLGTLLDRVDRQYMEAAEEPMVDTANLIAGLIGQRFPDLAAGRDELHRAAADVKSRRLGAAIYSQVKTAVTMDISITDASGTVLFDSTGRTEGQNLRHMRDVALTLAGNYGARSTRERHGDTETSVMHVGAPILQAGRIAGVVTVSKPQHTLFPFRDETRARIKVLALTFLGITAAGTVLVALFFTRPIRRLTNYARAVSRGERPQSPRMSSPEARRLRDALEQMRDALEDRAYVRTCVQTLTHEMKSPLATIRGAAELLEDAAMPAADRLRFLGNIRSETARLQRSIDRMLALSAVEARKHLEQRRPVSLGLLAGRSGEALRSAAEARGVKVVLPESDGPEVSGDEFLLETALNNLIENAVSFSPPGGTVTVAAGDDPAPFLSVTDEGPGIPEYALPRVFERFYSLPHPDTGLKSSGLGLCFVREAAQLHGGAVTLTNRRDRSGASAVLTFPGPSVREAPDPGEGRPGLRRRS